MKNLLNKGFNFSILPLKLDLTQVLVDFKRFERSMIWHEFFHGKDIEHEYKEKFFKTRKTNLPKNYKSPGGLKTFLGCIQSEIMDHRNRNTVECNLPPEEIVALRELIELQKKRIITIKPCDKGAGMMILDFPEYLRACYEHLVSEKVMEDKTSKKYYTLVEDIELERTKFKIRNLIEEGLEKEILAEDEYSAMKPDDKDAAKFYCTFKVHKDHAPMTAPPVRPIVSSSGSVTENTAAYVEYHIKDVSKLQSAPSYLQYTPDFLVSLSPNPAPSLN